VQGAEAALAIFAPPPALSLRNPSAPRDLPSLQKLCGSRFGWPASKTLEVA